MMFLLTLSATLNNFYTFSLNVQCILGLPILEVRIIECFRQLTGFWNRAII